MVICLGGIGATAFLRWTADAYCGPADDPRGDLPGMRRQCAMAHNQLVVTTATLGEVDALLVQARWRLWHGTWEKNTEQVETARATIDMLLERRYALMAAGGS